MATKGHKERMAEIDAERQQMLDMWDKSHEDYDARITGNEQWRQEQADTAAWEQRANQGWIDRAIMGASVGSAGGPIGALIGGAAGGLHGFIEGGVANEKLGTKDPWAQAAIPFNLDPTKGVSSIGGESARGLGAGIGNLESRARQAEFQQKLLDAASGQGNQPSYATGATTELMDPYSGEGDSFEFSGEAMGDYNTKRKRRGGGDVGYG